MAWTTSACLRARPSLTELAVTLKSARRLCASLCGSALRARPVMFLSLSALSLGFAAPLLPTSLITAILIMSGIGLAVVGTGANLAGTITSARTTTRPTAAAAAITEPPQQWAPPVHLPRPQRGRPIVTQTHHDWAELMARIHHELRTPLNAVIGFSEVMALEMFGPLGNERYRDYVRHIRDSADDLLKSAEDTLALTALLTSPRLPEPLAASTLDHAVGDAWTFVERRAGARGISLTMDLPPDLDVLSEPRALRQILVNMLSEGVARSGPGACMTLLAVADGELVELVLTVNGARASAVPRAGSLAICLARTLLEMQGTSLLEIETPAGSWSAVTVLDRAVQSDFFAYRPTAQHYQPAMAI